ncbi:helix-turn-helix domain-containing protein [bacterium]|nr:MAG: helix-turn-helix domain-containing protein [bacterium]
MKTSQTVAPGGALTEPRSRSASLLRTSARSGVTSGAASKIEKNTAAASAGSPVKQKRVRLKPESRDQLLERLRNPQLSLHEASILLRVSRATVRRYADAGRLQCLRTPGGQRRFYLRDIEQFYRQLKMRR